jgi:FKBP-type peptidyl-prolyl cis-trans isomerase (trigger factor)
MSSYSNLKKIKEKDGDIVFEAALAPEYLARGEEEAIAEAGSDVALPGFRKGKVPPALLRERMDPIEILEDAARKVLPDAIREIIKDQNLSTLGQPEVSIVTLAPGNPVVFTARFALLPEIKLPDYRAIAQKIVAASQPVTVAPEEIDDSIKHFREMFRGEVKDDAAPPPLPELTDEFVKQFGPYENVDAFREDLRRSLTDEKEREEKEKTREEIVRAIVAKTKIKIPSLVIDQELDAFYDRRDEELRKSGVSLEEYLKQIKKTEEELKQEERAAIERQIAASLVMGAMRKEEKITVDEKEITANIVALKRRYSDRTDAELWEPAEMIAIQKKLFDILEGVEQEQEPEPDKA